mgnify:CR=1 FL=1
MLRAPPASDNIRLCNLVPALDIQPIVVGTAGHIDHGKSTLVKLMSGELAATRGTIKVHPKLRMSKYHQHSADVLEPDETPLGCRLVCDWSCDLAEVDRFVGLIHG